MPEIKKVKSALGGKNSPLKTKKASAKAEKEPVGPIEKGLQCSVYDQEGREVEKIQLPVEIFGVKRSKSLIHQAAVAQMANARQVLAHAKDRSEVRGGGKKPWRQKGTGRARHGSIRSPLWRGGGVTFGPTKERNFSKKINKKMRRKALLAVLSGKVRDNELIILDKLQISSPKTKEMIKIIGGLTKIKDDIRKGALIVLTEKDNNIIRAAKNISKFETISIGSLNVVDLLKKKYLIMTKKGIDELKSKSEK
jgi:large subunit ribosomal protein L4